MKAWLSGILSSKQPPLHPSAFILSWPFGVLLEPFGAEHEAAFGDDAVADGETFEDGEAARVLGSEPHGAKHVRVRVRGRDEDVRSPAYVLHGGGGGCRRGLFGGPQRRVGG